MCYITIQFTKENLMNANRNTKTILNIIKTFIERDYKKEAIEAVDELITQIEKNEVSICWNIPSANNQGVSHE